MHSSSDPVIDPTRAKRAWMRLMVLQTIIVVSTSAVLIFGGYTAGPIPAGDYLMCVFANAAAPITIGFAAKRVVEEASAETAVGAAISGIIQPVAGLVGWVLTTFLFLAFLQGWQPPVRTMVSNPFGLWGSTLAAGVVVSLILRFAVRRMESWLLKKEKRRRSVVS